MSRRVGNPAVNFSPQTVYLDFPRSDGDETKWPTNTTRIVDPDGQVNFMELLDIETNGQARKWRSAVGKAIATKLELQGDSNNYVLRGWPPGYGLYDHHKGPANNPRHDLYLYGCARSGRFRSINEFIPHAIWLFTDPTLNYVNCECKYCTKQPQKGITASMGDILGTPSSVSSVSRPRREKMARNRPYASVQRALRPAKTLKPSAHVLDNPTLAERNSDLRAVFSRTTMKLKRWFREGEVVWCELQPPIPGPSGEDSAILFWPGLVQEYKLKAVAIPRENEARASDSNPQPLEATPGPSSSSQPLTNGDGQDEGRGTIIEKGDRTPFKVEQSIVYLVELFAVNKSIHVPDTRVIPYQSYIPPDDVIAGLQAIPTELLNFDKDSVALFNPCLGDQPPSFVPAAAPFAVALQIASNLAQLFSVTDEWEFTYTVPPPVPVPSATKNGPETSLESALNAASRINASNTAMASSNSPSPHPFRNLSSTQPDIHPSDLRKLADNMLGPTPSSTGLTRTQIRFQGLWWGPERIWVDDFVRLKVPRRCLAPHGAQNILAPAGPSAGALDAYSVTGRDPSEIGAGARGVFMRVSALFVVESTSREGRRGKECRISGPLFELVDEDWEETENEIIKTPPDPTQTNIDKSMNLPSTPVASSSTKAPVTSAPSRPPPQVLPEPQTASSSTNQQGSTTSEPPSLYLPPQPPLGYRFRSILTPGYEAIVSLSLLSGRYYPGLLQQHPLLEREVRRAAQVPIEEGGIVQYGHLWAIDGLHGGYHCSVDPDRFQPSRTKMLEWADREAYSQLDNHKRYEMASMLEGEDVDMLKEEENVDELDSSAQTRRQDRDGDVMMQG